ncbi:MAG: class I SAM-dependent methyltransferase [Ignavibacteria bacterium]
MITMTDHKFELIDGIKCYAPDLAEQNEDFQSEGFDLLFRVEEKNFWFRSRNRIIKHLFKKYLGTDKERNILEIGCGTGFVLKGLSEYKNYNLTGAEIHLAGLKYARMRLPGAEFIQVDATRMPFENQFDAIGTFDVLEHISEDRLVMKNIFKALKPGGLFFITVPQHQFMWSAADDIAFHKRRYSRKELAGKIKDSGFSVEYTGSFVTSLFPAMYLSRVHKKYFTKEEEINLEKNSELELSPGINSIFEKIMKLDELMIRSNLSLPFGGSLVMVARKSKPGISV